MTTIFEASRKADIEAVKQCIAAGIDVDEINEHGFSALHCAAMSANTSDEVNIIEVMRLLIRAGSNLEQLGGGGRTALYLAAEFSNSLAPVQLLLDEGAKANIYDEHGNHIVVNAMDEEVQALLSQLTGVPVPPAIVEIPPIKMSAAQWKAAKLKIDDAFNTLTQAGLVALQDSGTTQEDGFNDCSEQLHAQPNKGLHGFCYYTRQDLNSAKRTAQLTLAFWGAPEGAPKDMERVGALVVNTFKHCGFLVDWNGSGNMRPIVYLLMNPSN